MKGLGGFWLLAFLLSWSTGILVTMATRAGLVNGVSAPRAALPMPFAVAVLLILISGSGPGIAALAVSAVETRGRGVRALLRQARDWRAPMRWYAAALLSPFLLTLAAGLIWSAASTGWSGRWIPRPSLLQLLALPFLPWGEEFGWRGFAQPRLQGRLGWLPASAIVGVMWGTWHQWQLLTPAAGSLDIAGLGVFFAYIVAAFVLIGWIYNGAGRRLPLGWAGHGGLNAAGPSAAPFGLVAMMFGTAAVLAACWSHRHSQASAQP